MVKKEGFIFLQDVVSEAIPSSSWGRHRFLRASIASSEDGSKREKNRELL